MRDSGRVIEMASTFCPPPVVNVHRSLCSVNLSTTIAMSSATPKRTWEQFRAQWKARDRSVGGPVALAIDTWHDAADDDARGDDYIADEGEEHRFVCSNLRCMCPLWIVTISDKRAAELEFAALHGHHVCSTRRSAMGALTYRGWLRGQQRHGLGQTTYESGAVFVGQYRDDKCNGLHIG